MPQWLLAILVVLAGIVIIFLVVFALWCLFTRRERQAEKSASASISRLSQQDVSLSSTSQVTPKKQAVAQTAPPPDNLQRIEGIGPKIAGILERAGIDTFSALAATSVDRLSQLVRTEAGITIADPGTWPEQAALAAAGEWQALDTLQDELKGGRRI